MPKTKTDIFIGKRMHEEVLRLFPTFKSAAMALRCDRKLFWEWARGATPGCVYLARLYYHGGDVIYVLTGKRGAEDGN